MPQMISNLLKRQALCEQVSSTSVAEAMRPPVLRYETEFLQASGNYLPECVFAEWPQWGPGSYEEGSVLNSRTDLSEVTQNGSAD